MSIIITIIITSMHLLLQIEKAMMQRWV